MKHLLTLTAITLLSFTTMAQAKTWTIQAEGMMCEACAQSVTDSFKKNEAVSSVNVDLETQIVTVQSDDNNTTMTDKDIATLFDKHGYKMLSVQRTEN